VTDHGDGRIPDAIADAMEYEFDQLGSWDDALHGRFHAALDAYRLLSDGPSLLDVQTDMASAYIAAVPEDAKDPRRSLAAYHWRAIARCARGEPYQEELLTESPYGTSAQRHLKELRVYTTDGSLSWKLLKILVGKDGSFHCFNHLFLHINTRQFHYTYHPSGLVHWSAPDGRTAQRPHWPSYRELEAAPVDGVGFRAGDFTPENDGVRHLEVHSLDKSRLVFDLPKNPDQWFRIYMWLGKPASLRSAVGQSQVLGKRRVREEFLHLGSFVDPADQCEFDIGLAIALVLQEP
jgi:hypothetical protein